MVPEDLRPTSYTDGHVEVCCVGCTSFTDMCDTRCCTDFEACISLCDLCLVLSENRVCCCGMSVVGELECYSGSDDADSTSVIASVEPLECNTSEQLWSWCWLRLTR